MKLLAFDYGASSGRAILGNYTGDRLKLNEVHRFSNDPVMVNGSFHWDILRLFHEMKLGIHQCLKGGHKEIASIGIDTWGVDFGLLDDKGNMLGNPYHYRDTRNNGMIEEACRVLSKREIYEQTGIQFLKFNTLYQLLSMKLNHSPLVEKASTLLFIPDLLNYFLTGVKASEYTISSTSQMLNPTTGDWARPLLQRLGLPENILTDIIDTGSIVGKLKRDVSEELNIGGIPVIAVAEHDTGSAVVSVPAEGGKYAYLSSGTWSLLGVESEVPVINATTFNLNYTNEGGMNRSTRLLKNIMGLWIYQECKRYWDKKEEVLSFDQLEEMAAVSKPFVAFIDPDDDTFASPGNMPQKILEFCKRTNQTVPEDKGSIVRCIMESLALKYRMVMEGLEEIVGYTLPVLHVVGGGCKNTMLCQYTANAIHRPVSAGPIEATAVGNLAAQLIALKEVANVQQVRQLVKRSFPAYEYYPEDGAAWGDAYERFKKIIETKNL